MTDADVEDSPCDTVAATTERCAIRRIFGPVPGGRREIAAVVIGCLIVWVLRRPHQLFHPYVWAEESAILEHWLRDGWKATGDTVAGYLLGPVNVLLPLSAEISLQQFALLNYVWATLLFVVTVAIVVGPESQFGGPRTRYMFAASLVLCPINPEVYGVLLYGFWWATLWPLAILGWKRDLWFWRIVLLGIASLSSPAAGAVGVVYLGAFALRRRWRDLVSAAVLGAGFVAEVGLLSRADRGDHLQSNARAGDIGEQALRTSGHFISWWINGLAFDRMFTALIGFVFIGWLVWMSSRALRHAKNPPLAMIGGVTAVYLLTTATVDPLTTNPFNAGPRYYFLPYVGLSWMLIVIWRHIGRGREQLAAGLLLVSSGLGLTTMFSREAISTSQKLSWSSEIKRCARDPEPVLVRIYLDGSKEMWSIVMTPEQCRR